MVRGRVSLQLLGRDVSASMGDLWSRLAHLKHARWGREAAGANEVEAQPSRHFAALAALLEAGGLLQRRGGTRPSQKRDIFK